MLTDKRLIVVALAGLTGLASAMAGTSVNAQAAAPPKTDSLSIEEVIVTARRKEENLQSVPVSVTAISGEDLIDKGITNLTALQQAVPSLRVIASDINPKAFLVGMRGLKSQSYAAMEDSVVGAYFAEVVQAHPYAFGATLYDLQSIQVLKGPQGTLFGRNHTGGAILVEPNKASLSEGMNGYARVGFGNYDMKMAEGALNAPLNDVAALRLALRGFKRDGYTENILTGQRFDSSDERAGRLSLLLKPTANLNSHTIADYLLDKGGPIVGQNVGFGPGASAANIAIYQPVIDLQNQLGPRRVSYIGGTGLGGLGITTGTTGNDILAPQQCVLHPGAASAQLCRRGMLPIQEVESKGILNNTAWTLDNGLTIKNIIGYRKVSHYLEGASLTMPSSTNPASGAIGIQGIQRNDQNQLSEELQFSGKSFDNRLDWIAGYFWFRERYTEDAPSEVLSNTTGINRTRSYGENKAQAVFAQGTYTLSDQWKLTLGLRYNKDDRFNDNITRNSINIDTGVPGACQFRDAAGNLLPPNVPCHLFAEGTWNATTWNANVDYQLVEGTMFYAATRRGYKSGGQARNTALTTQALYNPEFVTDVELGVKSDMHWGDMPVRINAAIYHSDIKDLQVGNSISLNGGLTFFTFTNNAAKAHVNGIEFEATMRPTERLTLSGGFSYTDPKYDDYPVIATVSVPASGIVAGQTINLAPVPFGGQQIPMKWQGDFNVEYRVPMGSYGALKLNGELSFRSRTPTDNEHWFAIYGANFQLQTPVPGRTLLNLRADWDDFLGYPVRVSAFVNNATDKVYTDAGVHVVGIRSAHYAPPRMYGLELNYRFGEGFKPK